MSRKTLLGLETKWAAVWPAKERLAGIFIPHPRALNTLHYADFEDTDPDLLLNLTHAANFGGSHLNALQLDMVWPNAKVIRQFRTLRPDLKIILQISGRSMEQEQNDPDRVAVRVQTYDAMIDYVLLDQSMGRGLTLDPGLIHYLRAIRARSPDLGLAVAGGLGPYQLDVLKPIIAEFPDVSIDAYSRLRRSGNAMDPIDWGLAALYLNQAIRLLPD
jgi:hypothetical protein